jgi:hypothetical protein
VRRFSLIFWPFVINWVFSTLGEAAEADDR